MWWVCFDFLADVVSDYQFNSPSIFLGQYKACIYIQITFFLTINFKFTLNVLAKCSSLHKECVIAEKSDKMHAD